MASAGFTNGLGPAYSSLTAWTDSIAPEPRAHPIVWATQGDWKKHYEQIRRLYVVENRTLEEVLKYMKDEYNLNATSVISSALAPDEIANLP